MQEIVVGTDQKNDRARSALRKDTQQARYLFRVDRRHFFTDPNLGFLWLLWPFWRPGRRRLS
jgi:hypothetical protein